MSKLNRREFLERAAVIGVGIGAGTLFVGCKSGGGGLSCTDTTGLAPADAQLRTTSAYVDHSPHADKHCANCSLFQSAGDAACGTCTVLKGPINPAGYCNLWAAQAA